LRHRRSFTIAANDHIIDVETFNDAIIAYRNGGKSGFATTAERSPVHATSR
jgi:hypothetical protein